MTPEQRSSRALSIIFAQQEIVRLRGEREALKSSDNKNDWRKIERLNRSEDRFSDSLMRFWEDLSDEDARAVRAIVNQDPSTDEYNSEWAGWERV